MDILDQIRSRLSIEDVVGRYVSLKKSGKNLKALCPFHQEKTPSFIISPDKGLAYCFGCRKGGDIFTFIQEIEQVDFRKSLEMLAEQAGVSLQNQPAYQQTKKEKNTIEKILNEAHRFFQHHLFQQKAMLDYLEKRGFDQKAVKTLELGYAPNSFHLLTERLLGKGFSTKDLLDSGIASQKEVGDKNIYDRFRNRIMFPIHDSNGNLVAFGGRSMDPNSDAAKYLNSPETKYYHKGSVLYLFHRAKKYMHEKDQAIIVEGYFDALMAHLKSYPETVASLGTALTEDQIRLIGRFTKRLLFAFDPDISGNEAASRSIEIAQRLGYEAFVLTIPGGKDPDESILEGTFPKSVENALTAMDYEFQKSFSKNDQSTLHGKKNIMMHLFSIIQRLPSAVDQEFYLKKLASELHISLFNLMKDYERIPKSLSTISRSSSTKSSNQYQSFSKEEYLFGILIGFPKYIPLAKSNLKEEYFIGEEQRTLYKQIIDDYNPAVASSSTFQLLELFAQEKVDSFTEEELKQEVIELCQAIRSAAEKRRRNELRFQIEQKEKNGVLRQEDPLLAEYQLLINSSS